MLASLAVLAVGRISQHGVAGQQTAPHGPKPKSMAVNVVPSNEYSHVPWPVTPVKAIPPITAFVSASVIVVVPSPLLMNVPARLIVIGVSSSVVPSEGSAATSTGAALAGRDIEGEMLLGDVARRVRRLNDHVGRPRLAHRRRPANQARAGVDRHARRRLIQLVRQGAAGGVGGRRLTGVGDTLDRRHDGREIELRRGGFDGNAESGGRRAGQVRRGAEIADADGLILQRLRRRDRMRPVGQRDRAVGGDRHGGSGTRRSGRTDQRAVGIQLDQRPGKHAAHLKLERLARACCSSRSDCPTGCCRCRRPAANWMLVGAAGLM